MQLDPDQIKVLPAFPCACTRPKHYAEFTKENVLLCSESSIFDPDPKQSLWIGGDTDSKPDLVKLVDLDIPERVGAKYTKFGLATSTQ